MPKTEGTVWGEVSPIPMLSYCHTFILPFHIQLSGLDEAIELAELDTQFAMHKSKGQLTGSWLMQLTNCMYSLTTLTGVLTALTNCMYSLTTLTGVLTALTNCMYSLTTLTGVLIALTNCILPHHTHWSTDCTLHYYHILNE